MTQQVLITLPQHDDPTAYLAYWCSTLDSVALYSGWSISYLRHAQVTKNNVENYLTKNDFTLVLLNGHGSPSSVYGHEDEELISAGVNSNILSGKIVHVFSCSSGKLLGKQAILDGCLGFIGYNRDFKFLTDGNKECNPRTDKLAEIFSIPALVAPTRLLKHDCLESAYNKSQKKYWQMIECVEEMDVQGGAEAVRRFLFWNMRSQVFHHN
jgi:hypothetical protein